MMEIYDPRIIDRPLYTQRIMQFVNAPVIKVLTGMRRSGKSTLLDLTREELLRRRVPSDNILSINLESLQHEHLRDYRALYDKLIQDIRKRPGRVYIFLDEIQNVRRWEDAVNSLRADADCDLIITGSNSRLLSGELATVLAGRYVEIPVHPLSFAEYLKFASANPSEQDLSTQQNFENYLRYGGLPGIHQLFWTEQNNNQYLQDIFNSVLLKDVVERHRIRTPELLTRISACLMDNVGNIFSAKNVADVLRKQDRDSASTETVYTYLQALETAFLFCKVPRYDIKGKRLLQTMEKYYLTDLGLKHAVLGYRRGHIGSSLENVVFLELQRRGYNVHVGKLGAVEIDFIAERRDERLYIQVAYVITPDNEDREFGPLEAIRDHYEKLVLSMDTMQPINRNGIHQCNLIDWLLKDSLSIDSSNMSSSPQRL